MNPLTIFLLTFIPLFTEVPHTDRPIHYNSQSDGSRLFSENKMKAIYLFEEVDVDSFFRDCRSWGINMVFTNSIYWENRDFITKAKRNRIDIGLLFPVFFDATYLQSHPEDYCITSRGDKAIKDWLHFGCPSSDSFSTYQKETLRRILPSLKPKVVVFDFIRFFVHWEKTGKDASFSEIEDGCYCDRCLNDFQEFSGIQLQERNAQWIKQNAPAQWTGWKCSVIENKLEELAGITKEYSGTLPKGIKLVPWSQDQYENGMRSIAGQDLNRLKNHADFFISMTYSHLLDQKPEWIAGLVNETKITTGKKVYATIQMEKVLPEQTNITDEEFKAMLDYGFKGPSEGVILFYYKKGSDNNSKGKIVNAIR